MAGGKGGIVEGGDGGRDGEGEIREERKGYGKGMKEKVEEGGEAESKRRVGEN